MVAVHVASIVPYEPILQRVPDGRLARVRLLDPIFLGYLSLVFGSLAAALCAAWNAVAQRRFGRAVLYIFIGAIARIGFAGLLKTLFEAGLHNLPLLLLFGRTFHLAIGCGLAYMEWGAVRGHRLLGGQVIPLLWSVLAAMGLGMIVPGWMILRALGLAVGP